MVLHHRFGYTGFPIGRKPVAYVGWSIGEDAEHRRAGTRHCGIERAVVVEGLFGRCQFGVEREDRCLEVVAHGVFPLFDGQLQQFVERCFRLGRMHVAVGLLGAHAERRFDHDDEFSA